MDHHLTWYYGFGSDIVPAVEYYPTRDYLHDEGGITEDHLSAHPDPGVEGILGKGRTWDSRFITESGWVPGTQTLYQAEKRYDGGTSSYCNDCHSASFWRDTAELQNWDAYQEDNNYEREPPLSHDQAWTIANAGATNSDVISTDEQGENSIFEGGFAGKCEGGLRWQYIQIPDGRWECSGDFGWEQLVNLPETDGTFAALMIPHTNFRDPDSLENNHEHMFFNYHRAIETSGLSQEWGKPQRISVVECWSGDTDERDQAETVISAEDIAVPDSDTSIAIYGELQSEDKYSCTWEYETNGEEFTELSGIGDVIKMHETPSQEFLQDVVDENFENVDGLEPRYDDMDDFLDKTQSGNFQLVEMT